MRKRPKTHDDLPFRLIFTYNPFALNIKPSDNHSRKNVTSHRNILTKRSLLHVAKMSRSERASRIGSLYDGLSDSAAHQSYFGNISRGVRTVEIRRWFFVRRYWTQCHASWLLIGLSGVEWWVRNELGGVVGWEREGGWTWNLEGTFRRMMCAEGFGNTLRSLRDMWTWGEGNRIIRARSQAKGELLWMLS